jgi:hypothetical protein
MLDGFAVQVALEDPVVDQTRAFNLTMQYVAAELGFDWSAARGRRGRSRPKPARPARRRSGRTS